MKITSKGQVTIPKKLREKFGLNENTDIDFLEGPEGIFIVKATGRRHPVDRVYGVAGKKLRSDDIVRNLRGE